MEITEGQYALIKDSLPGQRGNVSLSNLQFLNAVLYVAEHGCKWRGLPKRFGNWHTIYTRMNRWSKSAAMDRVFEKLQLEQIVRNRIEAFSLDSTSVNSNRPGSCRGNAVRNSASAASSRILYRMEKIVRTASYKPTYEWCSVEPV
jgi:transposase